VQFFGPYALSPTNKINQKEKSKKVRKLNVLFPAVKKEKRLKFVNVLSKFIA